MKTQSPTIQDIKLDIVGSSTFGRDPKIQSSRTFNMIIADGWFIDYAGYKKVLEIAQGKGRGQFTSVKANRIISVIENNVFSISISTSSINGNKTYTKNKVGTIGSFSGDVFIDENNTNQIAICDKHKLYIYNHQTNNFAEAVLPSGVNPGYVCYQNGRFVIPDTNSSLWYLSAPGDGLNWFWGNSGNPVFSSIQTKPDFAIATIRVPGRGNLLYVMGKTVTEPWTDIGSALFPYQRSSSSNIDFGCVNAATISSLDDITAWLGQNEKSGLVIMYSTGSDINQVSTDGINDKLSQVKNPAKSSGFFVKLSGHLIYQLTFYDEKDNYSLIYDFTEGKFYDVTNEDQDFHIAKWVSFIDGDYYFISFIDGNLYQFSSSLTTFDYGTFEDGSPKVYEIPRIRVCQNVRFPNTFRFSVNNITLTLEQGNDTENTGDVNYQPRIGLAVSQNGGISFSGYATVPLNKVGNRMNITNWWNIGSYNDFVPQFRFWSKGKFRATDGVIGIFQ